MKKKNSNERCWTEDDEGYSVTWQKPTRITDNRRHVRDSEICVDCNLSTWVCDLRLFSYFAPVIWTSPLAHARTQNILQRNGG